MVGLEYNYLNKSMEIRNPKLNNCCYAVKSAMVFGIVLSNTGDHFLPLFSLDMIT